MAESAVEAIYITGRKGDPMTSVVEATARVGLGVEGDRTFRPKGNEPDREITLIEAEAIEALVRDEGVPFDHRRESAESRDARCPAQSSGRTRVHVSASVRLKGIRLCEPCGHLEKLTRPGVQKGLLHRGWAPGPDPGGRADPGRRPDPDGARRCPSLSRSRPRSSGS